MATDMLSAACGLPDALETTAAAAALLLTDAVEPPSPDSVAPPTPRSFTCPCLVLSPRAAASPQSSGRFMGPADSPGPSATHSFPRCHIPRPRLPLHEGPLVDAPLHLGHVPPSAGTHEPVQHQGPPAGAPSRAPSVPVPMICGVFALQRLRPWGVCVWGGVTVEEVLVCEVCLTTRGADGALKRRGKGGHWKKPFGANRAVTKRLERLTPDRRRLGWKGLAVLKGRRFIIPSGTPCHNPMEGCGVSALDRVSGRGGDGWRRGTSGIYLGLTPRL